MPRSRPLRPHADLGDVALAYPQLRQSLLAEFDSCALMALFGLEAPGYTNPAQARGIIFHRFAAEALRTLRRTGEVKLDFEDGMAILYEQAAQRDVPDREVVVVNARERRLLRMCVVQFCRQEFNMARLVDVERRLHAVIQYPDPDGGFIERVVTGQPDALISDGPDAAIVLDWKTTLQPPPEYTGSRPDTDAGVSYFGYFQQRVYALLVMKNYPAVQRVTLREFYPLKQVARTATVLRQDLEHVERELSTLVELLDRALKGGHDSPVWQPSPGKHCNYCPAPNRCPIEADVRAFEGGIATQAQAQRAGDEYAVATRVRKALHAALSDWCELHGELPLKSSKGRYVLGWQKNKTGGGKRFGLHVPVDSDRGPEDPSLAAHDEGLAAAFAEAAERRRSAA